MSGRERERDRERALSEEHRFSSNSISVLLILDCRCLAKRWFYGCWEDKYFISPGIISNTALFTDSSSLLRLLKCIAFSFRTYIFSATLELHHEHFVGTTRAGTFGMVWITQSRTGEHVNAYGVWDLLSNMGKMTVLSLCFLLCTNLLDLAVGE